MPTVVIPVARANHWHSPHWLLWVNQQIGRYSIKAVTDVYLFYSIPVLISGIHFQKMVCEFILFKKINIFQVHSVTRNWNTLNPSSQYAFIVTTSVFATKTSNWTDLPTHICNLPVVSFNVGPAFQNYCFPYASTYFFALLIQFMVGGVLEPITAVKGWKTGYNLHRFPIGLNPGWGFFVQILHALQLPPTVWRHAC